MERYKVSGYSSKYTLFQSFWLVDAKNEEDAIEQVATSFRERYPEYVVDAARQELRAYIPKQVTVDEESEQIALFIQEHFTLGKEGE